MRRRSRAGIFAFSLEGRGEAIDETLRAGGRSATLEDGWIVLRRGPGRPRRVVRADELPVTLAGLSRYNVANALAAAAACDALGVRRGRIADGLRSFAQDTAANPGRMNLFERDGIVAMVDFAHNEAGLAGLLDVARALAGAEGRVRLAFGTAGDRTDDILHGLGRVAGSADDLVIAEKEHYLRGRDLEEMNELLRAGARAGGHDETIHAHSGEIEALKALLGRARRGDVVVVMAHLERGELFAGLEADGFRPVGIDRLRERLGH
jgi:cyanophycin synthetase